VFIAQILGYARKTDGGWSFSPHAISILEEFQTRFPRAFERICDNPKEDKYYEEDLFPDPEGTESLSAVKEWLKQLPTNDIKPVQCGSFTLDEPQIAAIEKAVLDMEIAVSLPFLYQ